MFCPYFLSNASYLFMSDEKPHIDPLSPYANEVGVYSDSRLIELRFNNIPSPVLVLKLQVFGFSRKRSSVVWKADYTRDAMAFANILKEVLPSTPHGQDVNLQPGNEAIKANIDKKEFSLVSISLKDNSVKSYLVFEPAKAKAEIIANAFAEREFGKALQTVAVFPRVRVRDARLLFEEGKIIHTGVSSKPETPHQQNPKEMETPKSKAPYEIRDEYYNSIGGADSDSLFYTKIKRADFEAWIDRHYPDLPTKGKDDVWQYHMVKVSTEKEMNRLPKPMQPYSTIYNKLLKVIPGLPEHLQAGTEYGKSHLNSSGMMDLSYDYLGRENEDSYLIALAHNFEQNGDLVPDPDMQIRIKPGMKVAEAMTYQDQFGFQKVYFEKEGKKYVYPKLKKDLNYFLNQWLSNLIEQGHRIVLSKNEHSDENEDNIVFDPETTKISSQEGFEQLNESYSGDSIFNPKAMARLVLDENYQRHSFEHQFHSLPSVKDIYTEKEYDNLLIQYNSTILEDTVMENLYKECYKTVTGKDHDEAAAALVKKSEEGDKLIRHTETTPADTNMMTENNDKMPLLEVHFTSVFANDRPDFSKAYVTHSWKEAGDHFKKLLAKGREFVYKIIWQDGEIIQASLSEPFSKTNESITLVGDATGMLLNFTKAKYNPESLVSESTMKKAELLLREYSFSDDDLKQEPFEKTSVHMNKTNHTDPVIDDERVSEEPILSVAADPLANDSGVYTPETAGDNFEKLEIPMPKTAGYAAAITLVKISSGDYKFGIDYGKTFGDYSGGGYFPSLHSIAYPTRVDALQAALQEQREIVESYIRSYDSSLDHETVKIKHLESALDAIMRFAIAKGVPLITNPIEAESQTTSSINITDTEMAKTDSDKEAAVETTHLNMTVPNVLIPAGAKEPFISRNFSIKDLKGIIARDFPHLKSFTDKNLSSASALELFYLLQTSHPTDIGLKPSRMSVLEECTKRGAALLTELGYPTDLLYPYVNQYVGYQNVESLKEVLGERQNTWWSAVENYFPIADLQKGILIMDELKVKLEAEKITLTNPNTGKPFSKTLDNFRSVKYDINSLAKNKQVVADYLDNHKEIKSTESVKNELKIPVLSIYLTTEAHNHQADFSKADIMHTWQKADSFVRAKIGIFPDVYYKVLWQDGYTIKGIMDIEPEGFFDGKTNLLGNHILTFYTNVSKVKNTDNILPVADPIYGDQKVIESAKHIIERYQFFDETIVKNVRESLEEIKKNSLKIIKGLENVYWTDEDEEDDSYPFKIMIEGQSFHALSLQELLLDTLRKLSLEKEVAIADLIAKEFKLPTLDSYKTDNGSTIRDDGLSLKKQVLNEYFFDLSNQHDFSNPQPQKTILGFLITALMDKQEILVDNPVLKPLSEKTHSVKKLTPHELNKAIESFIDQKDKDGDGFSENDKTYILQYTGSGGLIKQGAEGRGTLYEYYTPDEIVQKMWGLAFEYGYSDGPVLEPACGTGNFLKYVPANVTVDAYETNHYAKRIAELCYPYATVYEKPFESIFFAGNVHLKDKFKKREYALIIGNPPYGEFTGKYAGMGEKKWTGALFYDHYFMLRGLDLLIPDGLLIMIIPSQFLENGEKYNKIKEKISIKATLLDAYRLPSRAFQTTDIGTDIIVLQKK